MDFAIMMWVGNNVKVGSIFGVLDKANPGKLPRISETGHWEDFRTIGENRFKLAEEAKKAITEHGCFLVGASITVTEAFGAPS